MAASDKYNLGVRESPYNAGMSENRSELAKSCAALRLKYKVPMKELAKALGSKHLSGWQYYENRVVGPYLDAEVAEKITPVFERHGASPLEVWRLVAPAKQTPQIAALDDDDIVQAIEDELAVLAIDLKPGLRSRFALGVADRLKARKPDTQ